ncbi:sarcosine oxidase subunit gamma [Cellulosimicrobium funkei]|nr:sarcosine oxidase subunit gamma [Cellulosimicrobium funkei]
MAENLMTRALRTTPAAHLSELMKAATVPVTETGERGVSLREIDFAVQIGLRAELGTASAEALEAVLGVSLPTGHGQTTGDALGQHVLWLAPDEFLAVDVSREQVPGDADALARALDGLPGQAVDLSANRALLELAGPSARGVLEKGCPADLHPRAFAVGTGIVTQLGPVPVILHRSAETEYRLYPRSSFADFLVRWLVDSMVEFGQEEVL